MNLLGLPLHEGKDLARQRSENLRGYGGWRIHMTEILANTAVGGYPDP